MQAHNRNPIQLNNVVDKWLKRNPDQRDPRIPDPYSGRVDGPTDGIKWRTITLSTIQPPWVNPVLTPMSGPIPGQAHNMTPPVWNTVTGNRESSPIYWDPTKGKPPITPTEPKTIIIDHPVQGAIPNFPTPKPEIGYYPAQPLNPTWTLTITPPQYGSKNTEPATIGKYGGKKKGKKTKKIKKTPQFWGI